MAGARTVEQLAQTKIILSGGREVRLSELGRVEDSNSEPRTFGRLNAQPVVAFAIFRSKGSSELSVKEVVERKLGQLRQTYPDVELRLIDDSVAYTHGNYTSALTTLIEGAVLAVIVVFLFLRNWRATLITAIALPLSAIPTFAAMHWMGFSLNVDLAGFTDEVRAVYYTGYAEHQMWQGDTVSLSPTSTKAPVKSGHTVSWSL